MEVQEDGAEIKERECGRNVRKSVSILSKSAYTN